MNYISIDGRVRNDSLTHYNHNHDALGRFSSGSGGAGSISSRINKIDNKTGKLQRKAAKYNEKAAKYNRKANKVKRRAANPIVSRTDLREAANYKALRLEGKGLKYAHKAERINKKVSKLNNERIKLGHERVKQLEAQYPDAFEPGWRDKYNDSSMFDVTATKKGNTYHVQSNNRRSKR